MKIWNFTAPAAALLLTSLAIAGCGEGSTSTTSASSFSKIVEAAKAHQRTATAGTPSTPSTSTAATPPPPSSHTTSTQAKTTPAAAAKSAAARAAAREKLARKLNSGGFASIPLSSSAFSPGGPIDARYTCDGQNISPPLSWHGVPSAAAELFLLVADIGGGASAALQWAVAMPPTTTDIPAGGLPPGAVVGLNSLGKAAWGGVCGEKGKLQHITFIIYALNHKLNLQPGFQASVARSALKGGLASGFTVATFKR